MVMFKVVYSSKQVKLRFECFLLLLVIAKFDWVALFSFELVANHGDADKTDCLDCGECQCDVQKPELGELEAAH